MGEDIIYRHFVPADAEGVIEVIAACYLDDYFHGMCYDAAYLREASWDGRRAIFVAQAPEGEITGCICGNYRSYFPGSYEIAMFVVKPEYQGKGQARRLLRFCVDNLRAMRIHGIYGMPVTYEPRSQYEGEAAGLAATGMWLGRYRSNRTFFKDKPRSPKLHSLVMAASGSLRNSGPLYAPPGHQDYIAGVYDALATPFAFAEGMTAAPLSSFFLKETADAFNHEIYIRSIGRDLTARLQTLEAAGTVHSSYSLFINMLDPGCEQAYCECRQRGYYFTGIHPLHEGCEYMMLHKEPAGGYVWEELVMTPKAAKIVEYILTHREGKE